MAAPMPSKALDASTQLEFCETHEHPHNRGYWRESVFINAQGLKLHAYDVAPPTGTQVRGTMIMVHGLHSNGMFEFMTADSECKHTIFEGSLADKLSKSGYHVFTYDQQAHGLSDGLLGSKSYVERFDHLASDLKQFATLARSAAVTSSVQSESLPMFALGESMGGGVVFRAAQLDSSLFAGLVLLAPMLSVEKLAANPANRVFKPIGSFISRLLPRARVIYLPPSDKFPHLRAEFKADPLIDPQSSWVRARTAMEMLSFCESAIKSCKQICTPFLTLHSQDDTLVDPDSSETLYRESDVTDKEFMRVDHMWHALLQEPGAEEVATKIVQWVQARS